MLFFFCQYFQAESRLKGLLSAIGVYTQAFRNRLKAERRGEKSTYMGVDSPNILRRPVERNYHR
jgi:hypothetical protein